MEMNIKFDEKMIVEVANRVLDEYEYNGKTIREWADLIANPKTNIDRIRSMTDEELAILFTTLISEIENGIMEMLKQAGVDADLIEFPVASLQSQLEYLQAEVQNG